MGFGFWLFWSCTIEAVWDLGSGSCCWLRVEEWRIVVYSGLTWQPAGRRSRASACWLLIVGFARFPNITLRGPEWAGDVISGLYRQ